MSNHGLYHSIVPTYVVGIFVVHPHRTNTGADDARSRKNCGDVKHQDHDSFSHSTPYILLSILEEYQNSGVPSRMTHVERY